MKWDPKSRGRKGVSSWPSEIVKMEQSSGDGSPVDQTPREQKQSKALASLKWKKMRNRGLGFGKVGAFRCSKWKIPGGNPTRET